MLSTIAEAAVFYRVCDKTVRRMIARGEIRAVRLGKRMIRVDLASARTTALGGDLYEQAS